MLKNYIKSAFRALLKHKSTTIINLLGLSIGICATILISIFVYNEISYDSFHEKADRTYRIGVEGKMLGNDLNMAVTSSVMAAPLLEEYPEVETLTRIWKESGTMVSYEDVSFQENEGDMLLVDSTFFDVFSFKLLEGSPENVLDNPESLVVTKSTAVKFFGTESPIGKNIRINSQENYRTISGVVEDPPVNSHFHFKYLAPMYDLPYLQRDQWLSHNFYTYVVLKEGTDPEKFTQSLSSLLDKYVLPTLMQILNISKEEIEKQGTIFKYVTTKLTDIHLNSDRQYEIEPTGNKAYVYVFSALALLILLVAGINFVNLTTARSADRSLEVGVRKLLGSSRKALMTQLLTESTLLSLGALIIAVIAAKLLMPAFNNLIGSQLVFNPLGSPQLLLILLALSVLVGILAGIYPAIILAATRPVKVLKGNRNGTGGKGHLRRVLVIMQFAVTLVILTSTITAFRQLKYMQQKDLGFDKENVFVVNGGQFLNGQYEAFRTELLQHSDIQEISKSRHLPGTIFSNNAHWLEGEGPDQIYTLMQTHVSPEWDEVMGIDMAEGRFFSDGFATDSFSVIINESAVRALQLEEPLKKRFWVPPGTNREALFFPIIGVVKDFHFESMKNPIGPAILYLMPPDAEGFISIKTSGQNNAWVMQTVDDTWKQFVPELPLNAFWLDDFFDSVFKAEKQTSTILLVFSLISIFISCLGLLGMISFTTRSRTREIAIRKTYGSSILQVVVLLFKETYLLLIVATLLAVPAYYLINQWMQNFAYRIPFGWISFGFTLLIMTATILILAAASVSQEAVKAARANPAEALMQ